MNPRFTNIPQLPEVYTNVQSNSANWDSAYTTATTYQSESGSYASTQYVNSNFLALSGGLVSGPVRINNNLTVFGNLTASGTTTFANTVFSVTSALSVIHVGSGPAMFISNNGDGDIASFYDIDQNLEVLHVGGQNGSFPNVGVKISTPNKDFTVNGEISANNTIYDATGNSNQWNQAFNISTAYQTTSGQFALSAHASTHHTGGTDAIAPNNISAAWAQVISSLNITGDTLLAAGRNRRITLQAVGLTANVDLPYSGNQNGDILTLHANFTFACTLNIRRAVAMFGGIPSVYATLGTLTATGQTISFISNGTETGWSALRPDTHSSTHHTGGTDAIAPSSIGAQSLFTTTTNSITGNTTIPAGRALIYQVVVTSFTPVTANINLPSSGHQAGDVIVVRSTTPFTLDSILTIRDGVGNPVDTITTFNQAYRYTANGTGPNAWNKILVDTHTHAATDITSGIFNTARIPNLNQLYLPLSGGTITGNISATGNISTQGQILSAGVDIGTLFGTGGGGGTTDTDVRALTGNWQSTYTTVCANSASWVNSKTIAQFTAIDNQPLSANFATLDTRISVAVLDFDDTTTESACFVGVIPEGTNLASGLQARLHWAASTATTGNVDWGVQFMNLNTPLSADSFDTAAFGITTTSNTPGLPSTTTITCTALNGMIAGSFYRMRVFRDSADTVNDTLNGDAELIAAEVRSVA